MQRKRHHTTLHQHLSQWRIVAYQRRWNRQRLLRVISLWKIVASVQRRSRWAAIVEECEGNLNVAKRWAETWTSGRHRSHYLPRAASSHTFSSSRGMQTASATNILLMLPILVQNRLRLAFHDLKRAVGAMKTERQFLRQLFYQWQCAVHQHRRLRRTAYVVAQRSHRRSIQRSLRHWAEVFRGESNNRRAAALNRNHLLYRCFMIWRRTAHTVQRHKESAALIFNLKSRLVVAAALNRWRRFVRTRNLQHILQGLVRFYLRRWVKQWCSAVMVLQTEEAELSKIAEHHRAAASQRRAFYRLLQFRSLQLQRATSVQTATEYWRNHRVATALQCWRQRTAARRWYLAALATAYDFSTCHAVARMLSRWQQFAASKRRAAAARVNAQRHYQTMLARAMRRHLRLWHSWTKYKQGLSVKSLKL